MDNFAMYVGYFIMCISAVFTVSGLLIASAMLFNKALWSAVKAHGGISVFNEYRIWLRNKDQQG